MLEIIEKLRKESKISKASLCGYCNISTQMYYKYLKGSSIPSEVLKKMFDYLGYDLVVIKRGNNSIKL